MIPTFPKFKKIDLADLSLIKPLLLEKSGRISDLNFASFFIWKEWNRPTMTIINDNLCIRIDPIDHPPFFLKPLGQVKPLETLLTCLDHTASISRLDRDFINNLEKNGLKVTSDRDYFDYIYKTDDLANFKGRKYDGKRNHINKFLKTYHDFKFEELKPDHLNDILKIYDLWFKPRKKDEYWISRQQFIDDDKNAFGYALENFKLLEPCGGVLYIDREPRSFIIGTPLTNDTVCVHFFHCDPNIPGIYQFVLNQAAKTSFARFEYVNLEDDAGVDGLRHAKTSYHPIEIKEKFDIILKQDERR